jgi:Ca2+-binding RTX toxin-like protein
MRNLTRRIGSPALRPALLAAAAVALIAAGGGAAGVAAGNDHTAATRSHRAHDDGFGHRRPHANVKHGVLLVRGSNASDAIALRLQAGNPNVLQVDFGDDGYADFSFWRNRFSRIVVDGREGDDHVRIDDSNGAFTNAVPTTIDGGDGNDTIAGGTGAETLIGGYGNDSIDGNGGNDAADLGPGDDTFVWDPGDGSDTIEGRDGNDTMVFNGANADEQIALSANGNRLTFFRAQGSITMDTAGVERVDFNALGGADLVTVNDLTGTDVSSVNVDEAGTLGGTAPDGQRDQVTVNGTNGDDRVDVSGNAAGVAVAGLAARVTILHQDATDLLAVNGVGGNDAISAAALAAQSIALVLDGGAGNDRLTGGPGVETLNGRDGNDAIAGNGGNDAAFLGAGDDTFVWNPGDGSDTIEGQDGFDTMVFNGANADEQVTLSANGNRLRFFRVQANITMDTAGVEQVDFNALGGADLVTVNDLTGTGVKLVDVDLAGTIGGTAGDGQTDRVVVNGTNGDDAIAVVGDSTQVRTGGLVPGVAILHPEFDDHLEVNTLAGQDSVDSGGLAAGAIQLFVNGLLTP